MQRLTNIFKVEFFQYLLLFIVSFGIYFFFLHPIFLNINSQLSSITLDSLKNYYTFVYHISNDEKALQFNGMNYPFGEHVVYTDAQPIISIPLQKLTFTHPYLIGILHSLMFLSFIVSPLVLFAIIIHFEIDRVSAFLVSIAVSLIAPQYLKINAGHFALAYGFVFPISILLLLHYLKRPSLKNSVKLFSFNLILFLLHPYLGFASSIFHFVALFVYILIKPNKHQFLKTAFTAFTSGLMPPILFKFFMFMTDTHVNRTTEPFGTEVMIENIDSLLAPVFGPFQKIMETFFPNRTGHFEGHSYLGFFTIALSSLLILIVPIRFKKLRLNKELLSLFIGSLFLLFVSFGWHLKIFERLQVNISALNQFRAVCRFAWLFYYTLPIFVFISVYKIVIAGIKEKSLVIMRAVAVLFFLFNLVESNYFFKLDERSYWKFRNIFHEAYLTKEEKEIIALIEKNKPQAILPLPIFHGGSEMYDRPGSSNSMLPAMLYSYHTGLPILSVMMSRTSQSETKDLIQTLNSYKKNKTLEPLFASNDFLIINTSDAKLPDEERLLKELKIDRSNDSLEFGFISLQKLMQKKLDSTVVDITGTDFESPDNNCIRFIQNGDETPFTEAKMLNYEVIYALDSNKVRSANYILSFHFHYAETTYRALAVDLIVEETLNGTGEWKYVIPVRNLSGFYNGFGVFEYKCKLNPHATYKFLFKGNLDETYRISNFLIRPEGISTRFVNDRKDTLYNNFPQ